MASPGSDKGLAQDATGQAILAALGVSTPTGGTGIGLFQDATAQAILAALGGGGGVSGLPKAFHSTGAGAVAVTAPNARVFCDPGNVAGGGMSPGSPLITFLTSPPDGAQVNIIDTSSTANNGAQAIRATAGTISIENPANPGNFIAGPLDVIVVASEGIWYTYDGTFNHWKLAVT